ncbi:lysophospholipid acyltransferase family protein [Natranaerobius trueperi]|uniref:1-acyl-sn-glycerol-3-phosphate acyltransferase n=1 Tax=Natranaerobius trueperi TaxID=759412 RepID=A0A226BVY4_9FIRM|nr:lysophospholipid acyltransferase family protein [Natranaerobius trueperi]OWZ82942.1 1-acyl-sn-glycerol-3-phosphate acyltransferase [Natranaerobius trueperi]
MNKNSTLYTILRGLFRLLFKTIYPIKIEGYENLPNEGPAILCSNHISLFDPILLGCISEPHVTFMAKEELFNIPVIGYIIKKLGAIPVKRGQADRKALKTSLDELIAGNIFGMFPEGTRKQNSNNKLLRGVGFIAAKSKAPVVPITIKGKYKPFRRVKVIVHSPINYQKEDFDQSEDSLAEFSQSIMVIINNDL